MTGQDAAVTGLTLAHVVVWTVVVVVVVYWCGSLVGLAGC